MKRLNTQVQSLYHDMIQEAIKSKPLENFFCKRRLETVGKVFNEKTYEGFDSSKIMSCSIALLLKQKEFANIEEIKILQTGLRPKSNHTFLFINNQYVIDPTYRQYFNLPNQSQMYYKYIFETNPPIFVGEFYDTYRLIQNFMYISGDHTVDWKDIDGHWSSKFWDVTYHENKLNNLN